MNLFISVAPAAGANAAFNPSDTPAVISLKIAPKNNPTTIPLPKAYLFSGVNVAGNFLV